MKVKLTDALVSRMPLPADAIDAVIWDADIVGFGLRIRLSGKTGILSYRHAGTGRSANTKRMKLAALSSTLRIF